MMASVYVTPINQIERVNCMSYSLSRDTIICSSNTALDCHELYNQRSQDELWLSLCEWVHVGETVVVNWLSSVTIIWLRCRCSYDLGTSCVCVRAWSCRRWSLFLIILLSFSLSLQIQFHSATANFRCSFSRMQRQPISMKQTEIGNSLPCIDPVTLRLGTQH